MKYVIKTIGALLIAMNAFAQHNPKGLLTGEKAPDFNAQDQFHKNTQLKTLLKKGPVVLVFYRGQWCPYCNKQLGQLEDSLSLITAKGATVMAITPELPEGIEMTIGKTKASYPIIHDEGLKIMTQYDVAYPVDTATVAKYKSYGIDFAKTNGTNGAYLPIPAVYIIGTNGKISYRHFNADNAQRASVKEILEHL